MHFTPVRHLRLAAGGATLALAAACSDTAAPPAPRPAVPAAIRPTIFDGAHNSGNKAVFFLPPMVSNPSGQPGYGDPVAPGLTVTYRVKCVGCASNGTDQLVKELTAAFATDHYEANWDTKSTALDPAKTYRIEVLVGQQVEAFADVDVVSSGSQLKRVDTDEYIALLDGRTLPIKVRVEQGVSFCTGTCSSVLVTNSPPVGQERTIVTTTDGQNAVAFPANWFDPNVVGTDAVIVTIQDATPAPNTEGDCSFGLTRMYSGGRCIRITTEPLVTNVTAEVRVAVCQINTADETQLLLKYDVGEAPTFLRNVPPPITCPTQIGAARSANPFVAAASATLARMGSALQRLLTPKSAYAIDLGVGGGFNDGGFSIIAAGNPRAMSIYQGQGQTGTTGTALAIAPSVEIRNLHRSHENDPFGPNDAAVTCTVTSGGGTLNGASSAPAVHGVEDPEGVYTCPQWVVGAGVNTLRVSAANLDDVVRVNDSETPFDGTVTFTATGVDVPTPVLALRSVVHEGDNDTYNLTVVNRASYPDAMFAASPNLPPCGDNTSASRTWVDIFTASGARIYGFCALGTASDLDGIWFSVPSGSVPSGVYVTLIDRLTNQTYTSNTISFLPVLSSPADLSTFDFYPRTTPLAWSAVAGADSYEVDRAYCESWSMPDYANTCTVWTNYPLVAGLTSPSYTFDFVGAQPGRWRVRAHYPGGGVGDWSAYRYFLYLQ